MADTTQRPQEDYTFGGGLSRINPAELPEDKIQKYRDIQQEGLDALQKRYQEPNWFKVAAGFAKPQLGGFLASVGSAAEALGENTELKRAQELPIAKMKSEIALTDIMLGQKQKQNEIYQAWRQSGKPMDKDTYTRIMSLGDKTDVASAATKYYEGAKAQLDIGITANQAMGKDPMLQLDEYVKFVANPNADPKQAEEKKNAYLASLDAAKPPQIDQAQWNAMSRYEKMDASTAYAQSQREAGMGAEEVMRKQANTAPERLGLLRSIRDLALGAGIPDKKTTEGKTISGQEQMGQLLNKFGGNNPMEVFARAAADGKLGETLKDIDVYARQMGMSEEAKNKFQVLVKLLAENQVALRGSSLNPTDAFGQLQTMASPNIGNSQAALVTLVDLLGHAEKHAQEKYNYAKDKRLPYGALERDIGYNNLRTEYAKKHAEIATSNPLMQAQSYYTPSAGDVSAKPEAKPVVKSTAPNTSNLTLDAIRAEKAKREAAKKQNP
jgi:hypothetical protein